MKNVLVVGSINIDLVMNTERVAKVGETVRGTAFNTFAGGKGANQAVAAARLGANVKMLGAVGNDVYGDTLLDGMQKDGIENSFGKIQSSVCSKIDTEAYLCQKIGSYLRVEFLFGENIHVEKTGVLKNVGKDFLVLTESGTDTEIVCSAKNIKFINIYNINKG